MKHLEYPQKHTYFFMDGRRYSFEDITYSELSTWQHLFDKKGREVKINPDNVKFVVIEGRK